MGQPQLTTQYTKFNRWKIRTARHIKNTFAELFRGIYFVLGVALGVAGGLILYQVIVAIL